MKVLFLTMVKINSFRDRGIYNDLLRKFYKEGHEVYAVCPIERREKKKTNLIKETEGTILNVQTFNLQKTNIIEKGIGTLAIEYQFLSAIKKNLCEIKFDLIIYSTPPITFSKVINFIKKRDNAYSYLLLKDIFPQNAVDMKLLKQDGIMHNFFLKKEKRLYDLSDTIGCMSEANVEYILKHNPTIKLEKVEVNPNTIEPISLIQENSEKINIKKKYNLPLDKKILVYGGNLGKPQGVDFLLETIEVNLHREAFFLIVGSGTEYKKLSEWFQVKKPRNALLLNGLSKTDYDLLLNACDVGMIFLHKDFTIPNFPSRMLSYLEMKKPIIAATDTNTDIGKVIEKNNCGFSVISGDILAMNRAIERVLDEDNLSNMQENAWNLLHNEFTVDKSYDLIIHKINV
ncbi:glycosyltransferase family 4 protein [Flavobacterium phragmitis]|nr:glycosyltransferase family 4 protein [Flavobacterium phragmitis]